MTKPAVTVVLPLFNAAPYIFQTLDALQRQTFTNFEAIVLDDGSTDDGARIVKEKRACDSRVSLVVQKNSGVSNTRNRGVALANAPIIAFLDADDVWHPEFLEKVTGHMREKPATSICFARARFINEQSDALGIFSRAHSRALNLTDFLSGNPTTTCSNLVVRRDAFMASGGFKSGLNYAEDQLWLLQMFLAGHVIEGLPQVLLDYRISKNGLSSDTLSMGRGWDEMATYMQTLSPARIKPALAAARALNRLYLAQTAFRKSKSPLLFARHMTEALIADWRTVVTDVSSRIASKTFHPATA
jgi:glycosyltransferase involved in cell wall biosynthesis